MKQFFENHLRESIAIGVIGLLIIATSFLSPLFSEVSNVLASSGGNVSGFGWSGAGVGWISFNSTSDNSLVGYSVNIDTSNRLDGGIGSFSGYAWSSNVGWVSFNRADTGNPPSGPFNSGVATDPIAQIDWSTGVVSGWARVLAAGGGLDGWIKLSDDSVTAWRGRGVKMDLSTGVFSGYAWGANILGWINFGPDNGLGGVFGPASLGALPVVSLTPDQTPIPAGGSTILRWTSSNTLNCSAVGGWTSQTATSGFESTGPLVAGPHAYTITCSGASGIGSVTTTVVAVMPIPVITLSADKSSVGIGESTTLRWTSLNSTSCTAVGGWTSKTTTSGFQSTGPLASGVHNYSIFCTGPGGIGSANTTVISAPLCGNNVCEATETPVSCPSDCKTNYQQF